MTKGTIHFNYHGRGFTITNGGGEGTSNVFHFLRGLQKRNLFETVQLGPQMLAHYLPMERMAKFTGYATRCGFKVTAA